MDIKQRYIYTFFSDLNDKDKKKVYFDQQMWNVFYFKKKIAKEGNDAIAALKNKKENQVYIFFELDDEVMEKENITYDEIYYNVENYLWSSDCYVVDKDFKWTFIYTHETWNHDDDSLYIGPFFYEL
jgi:hypothetical protein